MKNKIENSTNNIIADFAIKFFFEGVCIMKLANTIKEMVKLLCENPDERTLFVNDLCLMVAFVIIGLAALYISIEFY